MPRPTAAPAPRVPAPRSANPPVRARAAAGWRSPLALAISLALAGSAWGNAEPPNLRARPEARIFPAWAVAGPPPANPPTTQATRAISVSSCADDGPGSLREAVGLAADGDTIDLTGLGCSSINLLSGALQILADDVQLLGPGAAALALDGGGTDRVLFDPRSALTVTGLTIRNGAHVTSGFHIAGGGCIAAAGTLTLVDSVVSGCLARGEGSYGGAMYAYRVVMRNSLATGNIAYGYLPGTGTAASGGAGFVYKVDLEDSTISGNLAAHHDDPPRSSYDVGGGFVAVRGGVITSSTFSDNHASDRGGALNVLTQDLVISNSTFADNSLTRGRGGALYIRRPAMLALHSSTISGNRAAEGGGVHLTINGAHVVSSIIHGNVATAVPASRNLSAVGPVTISGDHNLIGAGHGDVTVPADTLANDPLLQPLKDNGGRTRTMALSPGSPAVDAGANPLGLPFDQRGPGYPRVTGAAPDIGAHEGTVLAFDAAPVPVLSRWASLALALLLAGLALAARLPRRRPWRN